MEFNERLKKVRQEKGLTQKQVADHVGVSKQTITAYEAGTREPDLMKLILLAEAMDTTPDTLLGRTIEKAPAQEEQELSEVDMRLLALPDDLKQTVLLLVSQAAEAAAPVVQVSELTARRIAAEILKGQESLQQDDTQVAQRR